MDRQPKQKSSVAKLALALILTVAAISIGGYFGVTNWYEKEINVLNSDSGEIVDFSVETGETTESIGKRLIEKGLLSSKRESLFTFYLGRTGLGTTIQAGQYRIPKNLNIVELAQTLQKAGIPDLWVTIPEGLRADEIALLLESEFSLYEESVFNSQKFTALVSDPNFIATLKLPAGLTTLEGYLYPDRYLLPIEATEEYVINVLLNNFEKKAGSDTTYEQLILASMLEREGRTDDERKMIADIINRRNAEGWLLNIDATILYYYKDWNRVITQKDLDTDQPYNTYTRSGFPPTPISNPGLSSIEAAKNPEPNQYYFYMHDNDGQIHYAKTVSEHNANVNRYLR